MCRQNEQAVGAVLHIDQGFFDSCLADEKNAREQIVQMWPTLPPLARTRCVQPNSFLPSYVEWLTCLEMTRDVIKLRNEQAASTPTGAKDQAKRRCPVVEV